MIGERTSGGSAQGPEPSPLGRVVLVTGPEEFLNERVVQAARAAVRRVDPEAELSETLGESLAPGSLGELAAPSLLSSTRCVVVRQIEEAPEESHERLLGYAADPEPDIALVLVHTGGQRASGLLNKLRKLPAVVERRSEKVKGRGVADFVQREARLRQGRFEQDAAEALVDAVGEDLRALSAAVHQLTHDFPGQPLTRVVVGRYFSGRAEVKGFDIADDALAGRTARALEELRWALDTGVSAPALTGSFATAVRGLARVKGAAPGARDVDLARDAGVPPWKVRALQAQARAWDEEALGRAVRAVAAADAEVKGAAADPAYALERMILTIGAARDRRSERGDLLGHR